MAKQLESRIRARSQRENIQNRIALTLARLTAHSGRLLFVPDEELIRRLGLQTKDKRNPAFRIRQAFRRLQKRGLVTYEKDTRRWSAQLTPAGRTFAKKLNDAERIIIKKPKRWDGRWRVVIFDIWERRRAARDKLRGQLQKAGFYKIQDSVWVHPYDCAEFIGFLKTEIRLGSGVLYMIAEGIEQDHKIRDHFGLK